MRPVIAWFRRNLRLRDNRMLIEAAESGRPVIPVYVSGRADEGGASRWWLHHSLAALDSSLAARGAGLVLRRGEAPEVFEELVAQTGAEAIYFARRHEPASRTEEAELRKRLGDRVELRAADDGLINRPEDIRTGSGSIYRVFTPYWRAASARGEPGEPAAAVPAAAFTTANVRPVPLAELALAPRVPDWSGGLRQCWQPGEDAALERLDTLHESVGDYVNGRDRPDRDATSRLSPHLHFGEISVRQAWAAVRAAEARGLPAASAEALLRQLYWRDFSYYLLHHFPQLPEKPLRPEFEHFPWVDDEVLFAAWRRGQTGYPIVDAGMRQLWETGWMHNRVRMITASFLVKDLMIPWQRGAAWFLDTLVDADLANNSAGWQWVAGCGTDAAPYFRIFNPTRQAEKFDPVGAYVRRWVPEAGTADYPAPIVDHGAARRRALEAYELARSLR